MHSVLVKTKVVDSSPTNGKKKVDSVNKKLPLCPKPQRPVSPVPEVLKPLRCSKHRYSCFPDANRILNMVDQKVNNQGHNNRNDGYESTCTGCLTPCYPGSPPGRTQNPLIYDEEFVRQMQILSPFSFKTACGQI